MAICRHEWKRNKSKTNHDQCFTRIHLRGLFLFILYIKNLESSSGNSKVSLFVIDTTTIKAKKKESSKIQRKIDLISDWMTSNKLTINIDKCEIVGFGSGKPPPLNIKDTQIHYRISCKYLGMHVDKWLRFNQHIEFLVKQLNKFCGLIFRIRHMSPRKCLLMFYNSHAKSLINYGTIAYGATAKPNLSKIEMAQRRMVRAIFFKKKSTPQQMC